MQKSKNQTFLGGALILILANLLVKVIGAVFKIPLTNLVGEEAMGLFHVAYNLYNAMFVLSTAGLPVAVSKMVSEANALGRRREIRRIVAIAFTLFAALGAVCALILLLGARPLAGAIGNADATFAVMAIAPSIFFVAVSSTIRGYYQGLSNMVPTAISQVIEALMKLVVGYGLAYYMLKAGWDMKYVVAGAISGVTIGTVLSALYLSIKARRSLSRLKRKIGREEKCHSPRALTRRLIRIAVPVTIGSSVLSLTNLIDMGVVMNRLQGAAGLDQTRATELYGAYSSMGITLFNLPQTLITAVSISCIPAISAAFARRDRLRANRTIESAMRITMLMALPCAAGFISLAGPILNLLYASRPEGVAIATPILRTLGLAVAFVAMVSLTNAILQAVGRPQLPVFSMAVGGVVKLVCNFILVGMPSVNIYGAPISTTLCYGSIMLINLFMLSQVLRTLPSFRSTVVRPALAAGCMGVFTYFTYPLWSGILGDRLGTVLTICLAAVLYGVLLLLFRAIRREDVLMLPRGEAIARLLRLK